MCSVRRRTKWGRAEPHRGPRHGRVADPPPAPTAVDRCDHRCRGDPRDGPRVAVARPRPGRAAARPHRFRVGINVGQRPRRGAGRPARRRRGRGAAACPRRDPARGVPAPARRWRAVRCADARPLHRPLGRILRGRHPDRARAGRGACRPLAVRDDLPTQPRLPRRADRQGHRVVRRHRLECPGQDRHHRQPRRADPGRRPAGAGPHRHRHRRRAGPDRHPLPPRSRGGRRRQRPLLLGGNGRLPAGGAGPAGQRRGRRRRRRRWQRGSGPHRPHDGRRHQPRLAELLPSSP